MTVLQISEMLRDVILWTSAPVLNNRGNGSRPGMMFTMTHTGTYTQIQIQIQTDTYKDIRQIQRADPDSSPLPLVSTKQKVDNITLLRPGTTQTKIFVPT